MSLKGKLVEGSTVRLWERVPDYIMHAHPGSLMAAIGDRVAEERLRQFVEGLGLSQAKVSQSCLLCDHPAAMHDVDAELGPCMRLGCSCEHIALAPVGGGAATTWAMTNGGRTSLLNGTFDIDTDTYKMALFTSASDLSATETTFAGVTGEHSGANGYTAGGIAVTLTLAGTTTVTIDISTDPVWTASGGSIVARFAAIYEVAGNILFYCTLDSTPADVTATSGNTLTVAAHASGVATLA